MRSITRTLGVSINTVTKLLVNAGETSIRLHDQMVRNVPSVRVECDEMWVYCYAKRNSVPYAKSPPPDAGDVWTWTAIDSDSKLLIS